MKTEYEIKFITINIKKFLKAITDSGAIITKKRSLMKRCTFDFPNSPRGTFLRVRDEGNKITLTYKVLKSLDLEGVKEIEVVVNSFDQTVELLKAIGAKHSTYEENYRKIYKLGKIEIMVDEWPGLPMFIEIEGQTKKAVIDFVEKYNLPINSAIYGNVDEVYKKIKKVDISKFNVITFENPPC